MKFAISIIAAFWFATPAYASEVEGCDSSAQLAQHANLVRQVIEDLQVENTSTFDMLFPHNMTVKGLDFTAGNPALTERPFSSIDLRKLASNDTYSIELRETMLPYACGSVVVKWTRKKQSKPYWMNYFIFKNGLMAEANEVDLIALEKSGPPVVPPPVIPNPQR